MMGSLIASYTLIADEYRFCPYCLADTLSGVHILAFLLRRYSDGRLMAVCFCEACDAEWFEESIAGNHQYNLYSTGR